MNRGEFKPNEDGTGFPQRGADSSDAAGVVPQENGTVAEDSTVAGDGTASRKWK